MPLFFLNSLVTLDYFGLKQKPLAKIQKALKTLGKNANRPKISNLFARPKNLKKWNISEARKRRDDKTTSICFPWTFIVRRWPEANARLFFP
jgi:hypothetical protein